MIINVNSNGSNLMHINEIKVYDGSMRTKVKHAENILSELILQMVECQQ